MKSKWVYLATELPMDVVPHLPITPRYTERDPRAKCVRVCCRPKPEGQVLKFKR